jgi:hypothetical protein
MAQSLKLRRSSVVTNGSPKLPTTDQIAIGELAINFAEGYETLSTRNNNNGIATFSSDSVLDKKYISSGAVISAISAVTVTIEDNETSISQTFDDHDDRIQDLENSAITGIIINGSAATVTNGVASANVSGLPDVSASDNGKILQVVGGQWTLVTPATIYTGDGTPDNTLGNNGDVYLQTS